METPALADHLSEGIQIFLIVSDKWYTSCHSHQIQLFGISEQVSPQYWCQVDGYCYYEHLSEAYKIFWIVSDKCF